MYQPLETASQPIWPGLLPSKFLGSRRHITVVDSLKDFSLNSLPSLGRQHYEEKYDHPKLEKPSLKLFSHHNQRCQQEKVLEVRKHYQFKPSVKPDRAENKHFGLKTPSEEEKLRGIRVYKEEGMKGSVSWTLEGNMGEKGRVNGLSNMRNKLEIRSLGDKIYKHPDYSTGFFKEGGLIPGSNFFVYKRKSKKKEEKKLKIVHFDKKAMSWKDRKERELRREDEEAVEGLFQWEDNVLTEANPNWKDPEKVGPPDMFAEREKNQGTGVKKAEVKKK